MAEQQQSHQNNQHATQHSRETTRRTGEQKNSAPQQMLEAPESLRPDDVFAVQQQLGNQAVQRALDQPMQREPLTDEQGNLNQHLSDTIQNARGSGSPLPKEIQAEVSQRFRRPLDHVRLHTDERADALSRAINARAFTIGSDIFFKHGVFAPGTGQGRNTLIHELTHVIQQSGSSSGGGRLKLGAKGNAFEKQAEQTAERLSVPVANTRITQTSTTAVQKAEEDELQMAPLEEEELQMAPLDEEELQMAPLEEEELQMAPLDEEELQMQPEASGVVQRANDMWIEQGGKWVKNPDYQPPAPKNQPVPQQQGVPPAPQSQAPVVKPMAPRVGQVRSLTDEISSAKQTRDQKDTLRGQLALLNSRQEGKRKAQLVREKDEKDAEAKKNKEAEAKAGAEKASKKNTREALINTIKDPSSSKEDVQDAQEKIRTLHNRWYKRSPISGAMDDRRHALKEAARAGDDEAFKKLQEEKDTMPTRWQRFKKGAGKFGSAVGKGVSALGKGVAAVSNVVLGPIGKNLKEGITQAFGSGKEEEEEKDEGGKGGGKKDGESDSGVLNIIKSLSAENEKLRQEVEALKKK